MLLITDRNGSADPFGDVAPTIVVRLDAQRDINGDYAAIACDVALGSLATITALRAALARYRTIQPLIVLVRGCDPIAYAMANALGATTIVSERSLPPIYAARGGAASAGDISEAPLPNGLVPELDTLVAVVAASLTGMFEHVDLPGPLDLGGLGAGGDALILAVKQNGICAWIEIVRGYDDATYQHCLLVAGLVARFAAHLGLSFKTQQIVAQAALLHDIGKSRVPRAILNKNGPLTPAEQEVMRKHPSTGYYMIAPEKDIDSRVRDIVRHHHEYLDGSGYPDRLRADRISELCRLVTICDIFAALIERRSYKDPMPPLAAYGCLVDMGRKLDGRLVSEFGRIAEELVPSARAAA